MQKISLKKMHSEKKKHIEDQLERPYYISQHDRSQMNFFLLQKIHLIHLVS